MAVVPFFTKTPTAVFTVGLDFTDEIPAEGVTLASGTVSARQRKSEVDATSTLFPGGTSVTVDEDANTGKIAVQAGTKGVWYDIFFEMTCSNGHIIPGKVVLFVDE